MSTTAPPRPITPDDLLQMGDEGKGFELVGGELKEWTVSKESSRIAGRICTRLDVFCESRGVGYVFPEGMSYQCFPTDPTRVRRADTSFIALSRMPSATYRDEGHCTTVPDLVVEVISPNDNAEEVAEKIQDWLGAGVKLVWEVYPGRQTGLPPCSDLLISSLPRVCFPGSRARSLTFSDCRLSPHRWHNTVLHRCVD